VPGCFSHLLQRARTPAGVACPGRGRRRAVAARALHAVRVRGAHGRRPMLRTAAPAGSPFTCLIYHSLSDGRCPATPHLTYTTTRAGFRDRLRDLRAAGFCLATAADLLGRLGGGDALPSRYCVLTLDDGHRSALDMAEVMLEADVRGTFFLAMDYCRERAD